MPLLKNKALILAKVEATRGTDSAPVAGTNAIQCESPEIEIISQSLERNYVTPYLGSKKRLNIGSGLKIRFATEAKGSGVAGTAPPIGCLFQACSFTETVVAVTSVTYNPNSDIFAVASASVTIWFYLDGIVHKVVGCVGTFSLDMKVNEYGKINWEFTGIYAGPTDLALATGTFNATTPARVISASFAIDSYAAVVESLKIDIGNNIAARRSINATTGILSWFISERKVVGEIDPEMVTVATKDFWTTWSGSSQVALTVAISGGAGNILTITAPKVMISDIKYGDRDGVLTANMPLAFTADAGNDEIRFAFT